MQKTLIKIIDAYSFVELSWDFSATFNDFKNIVDSVLDSYLFEGQGNFDYTFEEKETLKEMFLDDEGKQKIYQILISQFIDKYDNIFTDMTKVYHGTFELFNYIDPKKIINDDSTLAEGIGIYFTDKLADAQTYGPNIITTFVNKENFVDSRDSLELLLDYHGFDIIQMIKYLGKQDKEALFYLITDYGVFLTEPNQITNSHINEMVKKMETEQIRNFQITLFESFNTAFIEAWNIFLPDIHGTYYEVNNTTIYSIINTNYKLKLLQNV